MSQARWQGGCGVSVETVEDTFDGSDLAAHKAMPCQDKTNSLTRCGTAERAAARQRLPAPLETKGTLQMRVAVTVLERSSKDEKVKRIYFLTPSILVDRRLDLIAQSITYNIETQLPSQCTRELI
jgi:hypothetical protein